VLCQPPARFNAKADETTPHSRPICYFARMEKRIIQLETLSALQDEMLQALNQEVFRQQQDLARLQRRIETLEKKFAEIAAAEEIGGNEKPPHY
jgi:SlyX protein